ncbi:MAG: hypothetical protein DI570_18880 [Phenylobacterium zucineum]|nr:MAG: hypothetical protein DI570_18880 [Phenylobacterium zucineum]
MAERLARAEEWIEGHEKRCEERQLAMGREIRDLKTSHAEFKGEVRAATGKVEDAIEGMKKAAYGLVVALLAWTLAQLWAGVQSDKAAAAHTAVVVAPQK